jgi:hypothetical protein
LQQFVDFFGRRQIEWHGVFDVSISAELGSAEADGADGKFGVP